MSARKQQLLKRHRRNKRIGLLVALLALLAVGLLVSPWLLPILLVALWVAHEAWFADHLFYSPGEDYRYRFAEGVESLPVRLADGRLRVDGELREGDMLVLGIGVRAGWLGRFLEPSVLLEGGAEADAQAFERGVNGLRYLNLTGLAGPLGEGRIRLRGYFRKHVDVSRYDRILFFLRFKKEMRQVRFIRSVPNLVILEHDAYQNYIPCKYTGKFSAHYRRLPWARVISSGHTVSERLRQEGFDAVFVPKGYDQTLLHDLGLARDIELGFVGSTGSVAYSGRKALLDELGGVENLLVTKTKSGEEYLRTLNRIRFFVSADVGMGEYMIKNFEAMACGCVLLAYDQGERENEALGFRDMENIVLYRSVADIQEKLAILRLDTALAERIARSGQALAIERFSFAAVGQSIVEAMRPALREPERPGWLEKTWRRIFT